MTAKKLQSGVTKTKKAKPRDEEVDSDWDSALLGKPAPVSATDYSVSASTAAQTSASKEPDYSTDKIDLNDLVDFLKENLSLKLERGDFTDPNNRRISISLGKHLISSVDFDVVQKREYEG